MIEAVLFDLDGTLLDIDLQVFLREYFDALGPALSGVLGVPTDAVLDAVMQATAAMCAPHEGQTNMSVFNEAFTAATGTRIDAPDVLDAIETFYRVTFPSLRSTHGPRPGAEECVATARALGLRTALATNPIFPRVAIVERLRWAGLETGSFDHLTSYETSEACKPLPRYFRQIAEDLGVPAESCLMVGDDPILDMAAADVGMQTFYVGDAPGVSSRWTGSLADLSGLLTRIV